MDHTLITRRLTRLSSAATWPFASFADRLMSRLHRLRPSGPDQSATVPDEAAEAQPWAAAVAEEVPVAEPPAPAIPDCEPTVPTVPVTFTLPAEVGAGDVALCGDFNGWTTGPIPLIRDSDNWQVTIPLTPGNSYRYRYLLDGERWENAWQADRYEPNPFGSDDSVIIVDWPELRLQAA
ncbi:MAG TPA: isoamylase early set domain-containing protein [Streptosporangiaceae bacterium]|nr:isoamylase early set domain-containing protein [Streptosporangiaceae bacterium]